MSLQHQRPLLPRPTESLNDPNENPSSSQRNVKQKSIAACQACRSKKVKCDGGRPECKACRSRSLHCVYETEAGLTRREQMKRSNYSLQENAESFAKLYQFLQNKPTQEADDLFQRIRNGLSLDAAVGFVKNQWKDPAPSTSTRGDSSSPTRQWSQQIHDCNMLFEHQVLSTEVSDMAKQALREGLARYFACLGTMFPVVTKEEVDSIMAVFLTPITRQEEGTTEDQLVTKQVAYGELLALCAVGFQYDRQTLPNGSPSICTPFYKKARLFLDFVVENAPLRAMRMCCCLGIYNVISKSSLAVSYTDWGITLASTNGLIGGKRSTHLKRDEHMKYRRTLTALVTIRSWLTATLGHIPSPIVARCVHETEEQIDNTGDSDGTSSGVIDMIQQNMAKITVLKANVLRTIACFRTLSPAILQQMCDDLERWRLQLPGYMELGKLVSSPTISQDQRRVTFYMYLFYMSAIMLKARAVLARETSLTINHATPATAEERRAILDGISASRNSARLLGLIYDEGGVVKNCWLTIYQCYVTYLALNYAILKGCLVGGSNLHAHDLAASGICIDILRLCATKDRLGGVFYHRLLEIRNTINENLQVSAHTRLTPGDDDETVTNDDSFLFVDVDGTTKLHQMIRSTRLMLCYPLNCLYESNSTNFLNISMVDAYVNADIDFAHHLASPFNTDEDTIPDKLFPPSQPSQSSWTGSGQCEGFLSGSAPFDWSVSTWSGIDAATGELSGD